MYFGDIAFPRGIKRRIVTRLQWILILVRLWHDAWIRVAFRPGYSRTKLQFSSSRQWSTTSELGLKLCLKNEQECYIGFKTTKSSRVVLDPIKHVLRVVWTVIPRDFFYSLLPRLSSKGMMHCKPSLYLWAAFISIEMGVSLTLKR